MVDDGRTAFPVVEPGQWTDYGLTRRELFAVMAMQGLLAHPHHPSFDTEIAIAKWSVEQADALIKALEAA